MTSTTESVALRRRLRVELRRARLNANLTQKDVAERLDWSPSKIIRIESGAVAVTPTDLRALLWEYQITDQKVIDDLVSMARGSKKQPWSQYKDVLTPAVIQFLGLESAASKIRNYELIVIPGPLQTEEYARALLTGFGTSEERVERVVESRLEHQEILDLPNPPQMHFLIDEAAIRRVVGGPKTMEAQLRQISELARRPSVTVQVIPFPVGAHPGMEGPLVYLEFPDPDDDDVVYVEGRHGADAVFRDDPEVTSTYLQLFLDLERIACDPGELDEYLGRAIERLPAATHEAAPDDTN
jgi:transcriptional regulator with XRE-family HTH domain